MMRLSACYIVKNEERVLRQSMESLQDAVDEFIVVDTGSEDCTVSIAREFGAKVYFLPWEDDFSKPRNLAIDKATGDWIVFLDADEFFTEATRGNLRGILTGLHRETIDGLVLSLRNIDVDHGGELLIESYALRIFPKREGLRFCGRIHEELCLNGNFLSRMARISPCDLQLIHTGYSVSLSQAKGERNLNMLLREMKESSHPERVYGYLADVYLGMKDTEQAEKYARMDIASGGRKNSSYASRSYRILLQLLAEQGDRLQERYEICRQAAEDFPAIPEFSADLAECEAAQGMYGQAIHHMRQALESFHDRAWEQGWEPSMFTEEMAVLAKERMEGWEDKMGTDENISEGQASAVTMQDAGERSRRLFLALLRLTEVDSQAFRTGISVLLSFLQPLAMRYSDESRALRPEDAEGYGIALQWVLKGASAEIQERFLAMAADFSPTVLRKLADACMDERHWDAAFLLYGAIPADAGEADDVFWRNVGICFYHAGERETARECLLRARDMGAEKDGAVETYLEWCGEAGANA